jgi:hypothetical protein
MNIVKLLITAIFLFTSTTSVYAQDDDSSKLLDSLTVKMFKDFNKRDYDAIMDMTHPKIFDVVSKEAMIAGVKSQLEGNEDYSVSIPKQIPEYKLSSLHNDGENDTDYAFVVYDFKMSMTFKNKEFDAENKKMMKEMMALQGMEVEFVSNTTLNLNMLNRITILLNDESTNNKWAMVNYDKNAPFLLEVIPENIIEHVNEFNQELMTERKNKESKE